MFFNIVVFVFVVLKYTDWDIDLFKMLSCFAGCYYVLFLESQFFLVYSQEQLNFNLNHI